jgi:Na+/phosphate symporter
MTKKDTLSQDSLKKIETMCHNISTALQKVTDGFNTHKLDRLEDAKNNYREALALEKQTTEQIINEIGEIDNPGESIKEYVSIPGYLAMIGARIVNISTDTQRKIEEGILFSDKAASELNTLFNKSIELLTCLKDLIITKNEVLLKHVLEEESGHYKLANEYATIHEERLISGLCSPQYSALYLHLLGSIKEILEYSKNIAQRI